MRARLLAALYARLLPPVLEYLGAMRDQVDREEATLREEQWRRPEFAGLIAYDLVAIHGRQVGLQDAIRVLRRFRDGEVTP